MENAYWTGEMMVYGDGGSFFEPLAKALDVAAHEFTHGVIEQTVNLEYRLQSGALNESFADVFGAMVDREDWLMGEDVTRTTAALRDLETPENGDQPGHMDDFLDLDALNDLYGNPAGTGPNDSNDLGGVHINSGIPNRACFLIAEQIGREKTEQIYYRILEARYLISQARFIDLRLAAEQAAIDLFGEPSAEVDAVLAGFDAVGIVTEEATQAPEDVAAAVGDQWIIMVNAEEFDVSLLRATPDSQEIQWISDTQVSFATGKPVSVSADGRDVYFIDAENFIRAVYIDGTEEEVLTTTGEWGSLALSPDGTKLAVTTVYEDTTIFIFDLEDEDNDKEIKLYNPTTQAGIGADVARFADVLDWNEDSQHLVYDVFSSLPLGDDDELGYWSINILDTESEVIFPLFSGLPEGVHLANPSFANTNEAFVVFDSFDDKTETNEIWVFDTFTGDAGFILETGPNFAFPGFSSDDRHLAFELWDEGQLNVHQIALAEGRLAAAGANEFYLHEVQLPTWVTVAPDDATTDEPNPGLLADVNQDGSVTSADAILVMRFVVGLITLDEIQLVLADVNQDGNINAGDAVLTLRKAVGLIPKPVAAWPPPRLAWGTPETVEAGEAVVPLLFEGDIYGGDFVVRYDDATWQPTGIRVPGQNAIWAMGSDTPGTLRFTVASTDPLERLELVLEGASGTPSLTLEEALVVDGAGRPLTEAYEETLPAAFSLEQNFPNPFNSSTVINFDVPQAADVAMEVYNLAGQKVAILVDGVRQAGSYQIQWDGKDDAGHDLASGVYMYRVRSDGVEIATRKLLMLR